MGRLLLTLLSCISCCFHSALRVSDSLAHRHDLTGHRALFGHQSASGRLILFCHTRSFKSQSLLLLDLVILAAREHTLQCASWQYPQQLLLSFQQFRVLQKSLQEQDVLWNSLDGGHQTVLQRTVHYVWSAWIRCTTYFKGHAFCAFEHLQVSSKLGRFAHSIQSEPGAVIRGDISMDGSEALYQWPR